MREREQLFEEIKGKLVELLKLRTPNFQPRAIVVADKSNGELIIFGKATDCELNDDDLKALGTAMVKAVKDVETEKGDRWTDTYYMMVSTDKAFFIVEDFEDGFTMVTVLPRHFLRFQVGERFAKVHSELVEALRRYVKLK